MINFKFLFSRNNPNCSSCWGFFVLKLSRHLPSSSTCNPIPGRQRLFAYGLHDSIVASVGATVDLHVNVLRSILLSSLFIDFI